MSVDDCLSGTQFEGRITRGNASQALASLVDTIQSAEGFSPQQRVTVGLKRCSLDLEARQRLRVFMPWTILAATLGLPVLQSLQCTVLGTHPASTLTSAPATRLITFPILQTGWRVPWKTNEFSITCPFDGASGTVAIVLMSRIDSGANKGAPLECFGNCFEAETVVLLTMKEALEGLWTAVYTCVANLRIGLYCRCIPVYPRKCTAEALCGVLYIT